VNNIILYYRVIKKIYDSSVHGYLQPFMPQTPPQMAFYNMENPHFSVSTSPLTNHRCINITTKAGGNIAKIAVAITRFHSVAESPPAIMRLMPITVVYIDSSVVTNNGHK
jgi:hypothetical protein